MDQVPDGQTSSDILRARRSRMRAKARGPRPAAPPTSDRFQTPEWLDRTYVLPLTVPEANDVPSQPMPRHDDFEADPAQRPTGESSDEHGPTFVRPPTPEIDFARVISRSDTSRTASRSALASAGVTGLVLIIYLLTGSPVILGMALAFGLISVVAIGVRLRTATATLPHLDA